ncbi:SDR family NAD(P)-dependent oxidoreductase [Aeromicrobium sp. UC242_57]|uniref:SDR family NAD(P)-dependent oxidoreductase n=1 Tax=Aeromicrobium sp. UC242_57 TaxID=3374624 RepID=UPI0037B6986B
MNTIVITGSTKGLGFALARGFRAQGHHVVVTGRTDAAVNAAVASLTETPGAGRVLGRAVDVSDPDATTALWSFAVAELGRVDIWINNAGVAHTTNPIVDTTPDAVRAMVTTNMLGTIFSTQAAVRGMTAQGGGSCSTCSVVAATARPAPTWACTAPPSAVSTCSRGPWSRRSTAPA